MMDKDEGTELSEAIYADLVAHYIKTQTRLVRRPCEHSNQSQLVLDDGESLAEMLEICRDIASEASIFFYE